MKHWLIAAALGPAALTAAAAQAQTAPPPPPPPGGPSAAMARVDANGDGVITREEYLAGVDQRFARLDANGDGTVAPDEWAMRSHSKVPLAPPPSAAGAAPPPPSSMRQARQPMTRDAFRAAALQRFDRWDANRDGRLDQTEMGAMRRPPRPAPEGAVPPTLPRPNAE